MGYLLQGTTHSSRKLLALASAYTTKSTSAPRHTTLSNLKLLRLVDCRLTHSCFALDRSPLSFYPQHPRIRLPETALSL
ncbi:hypothetical protein XA68_17357 [Ophiocordyceps unilateralis]|uniref:Uncharacterized protein n=1 Tax=Ophiocordyceps unilateralis TaxID=268505 RepID=A0A2A9PKP0_OPHUN|nr:hypothetical protein XA68_17357 [Ophiocordyceps unilateralis]